MHRRALATQDRGGHHGRRGEGQRVGGAGKIAPCFSVPEFDATLDALHQIAANDRAAAAVMCVLGVADAMGKVGGVNLTRPGAYRWRVR